MICSDAVAKNSNDRKLWGTEFHSTNLVADIYLPQIYGSWAFIAYFRPTIISSHFTLISKIPGDTLLTKIPVELPSIEQIFTKLSSRLGALVRLSATGPWTSRRDHFRYSAYYQA